MKKKAIKIAAASAVAASAIVASAPAQSFAATNVAVTVDNAVLQMKKAFFTYNTPATQGQIADIAAVRAEYAKAKSMYASARTAVVKASNVKLLDKLDGYYADFIQKKVVTYIDAYTYGESYLKANKDALQNAITAKNYDDVAKFSKELSYQLNSSRRTIIDRVYGPDTRALFRATYTEGAKKLNDSILVDVEVYNSIVKLNDAVAKKDVAAGKVEVDNINALLPKVTSALKDDLTAKVKTAVAAYNALLPAGVESVTVLNYQEIAVKFNKELKDTDVTTAKFSLNGVNPSSVTLGDDNKTVTLKYLKVDNKSTESNDYAFIVEQITTKADANVKTARYVSKLTYTDTVAPSVTGVDYTYVKDTDGKVTSVTAVFSFSEPVQTAGTVSVDGLVTTATLTDGNTKLSITGLAVGKTYKVDIVGAQDVKGNYANPITQSITVPAEVKDTVKPTVSAAVSNNVVTLQFSKEVTTLGTVTINGTDYASKFVQDSTDKTKWTFDAQANGVFGTLTFINANIVVEGYKDKAGNVGDKFSATGTLVADTTAPKFVSAAASKDNSKILLTFDDVVYAGTAGAGKDLGASNELLLKVKDGVTLTTGNDFDLTLANTKFGYDLDGNGKIEGTEKNIVAIDYALTKGSSYTFDLAKDVSVADKYNNYATTVTFSLTVGDPVVVNPNPTPSVSLTSVAPVGNVLTLTFDKEMGDSALNSANYTLAGAALPSGTTLQFINNRQTVRITLPAGYITVNGTYVLTVQNVTDKNGNTLVNGKQTSAVTMTETIAPTATKVTLLDSKNLSVDFSEAVKLAGTDTTVKNVTVKVNGTTVSATLTLANNKLAIVLPNNIAQTDSVTVEFKNANIVDLNNNQLTDVTLTK